MTESDDPVTIATTVAPFVVPVAAGVAIGGAIGGGLSGGGPDIPSSATAASTKPAKTAARVEPVSDDDIKKKRLQASFLTEGFERPQLGKPGLLGLGT